MKKLLNKNSDKTKKNAKKDDEGIFAKSVKYIDEFVSFLLNIEGKQPDNDALKAAAGPIRFGTWTFIAIFVVGGLWMGFAPLNSAAIAPGSIVLDASRKVIDHLEGGIIKTIHVTDGDKVEKDQILLTLDNTNAKARVEILKSQFITSVAMRDRLIAERDVIEFIFFSAELKKYKDEAGYNDIVEAQKRIFESRIANNKSQKGILEQRIKQLDEEINGLKAQKSSVEKQTRLINEEIVVVEKLVNNGQAVKSRLLALKRRKAELQGARGEYIAGIARASQGIAENKMAILNLENESRKEVVEMLKDTQEKIADTRERMTASEDILKRINIRAPRSGIITGLNYHTIGGVVAPGSTVMEIIPQDDELIVEAQVSPQDIDIVNIGLEAQVRLSAFSVRRVPMLEGKVTHVSADRHVDDRTGIPYYKARIKIASDFLSKLSEEVELYPGMPAEAFIVTGTNTPLAYLLDPITASFNRAFKEK